MILLLSILNKLKRQSATQEIGSHFYFLTFLSGILLLAIQELKADTVKIE